MNCTCVTSIFGKSQGLDKGLEKQWCPHIIRVFENCGLWSYTKKYLSKNNKINRKTQGTKILWISERKLMRQKSPLLKINEAEINYFKTINFD